MRFSRCHWLTVTGVCKQFQPFRYHKTAQDIAQTIPFAREVADKHGVPLLFAAVTQGIAEETKRSFEGNGYLSVKIYVKKHGSVNGFNDLN
jgi:hypothetical protein